MAFAKTSLLFVALIAAPAFGAQVLKPQDVVDAILKKSFDAAEIGLNAQSAYIGMEETLGRYDLKIKAGAGYRYDEAEDTSGLKNPINKTLLSNLSLEKAVSTGSVFEFGYAHEAQASVLNPIVASTRTPTIALDAAYLEWRQNLWSNMFGLADRLDLTVARTRLKSSDLKKQEDTEQLVLKALELFWNAYVAQTQLQDAVTAREQYQKLIGVVQRRGRFGLEKGGEYAQVMADFTDADNKVKNASYAYLTNLTDLEIHMQTEFGQDVKFDPGTELVPALPQLPPIQKESLRSIQVAKNAVQNAKDYERAIRSRGQPDLNLVARATTTGVDEKASRSYSEFVAGNNPTYYVGVQFAASFDSSVRRAAEADARVSAERNLNALRKTEAYEERNLVLYGNNLQATFAVANGAVEAEKFRSRTVREQEVEYRQGRLPLRDLLQTYRLYFDAQAQKVRAIGNYHIALNSMAAMRDELVK